MLVLSQSGNHNGLTDSAMKTQEAVNKSNSTRRQIDRHGFVAHQTPDSQQPLMRNSEHLKANKSRRQQQSHLIN